MYKYTCTVYFVLLSALNIIARVQPEITTLSIKDAIDIAIKNHPEVNKARYSVESVKGKYYQDISLPQPEITLGYEFIPLGNSYLNGDEQTLGITQQFPFTVLLKGSRTSAFIDAASSELNSIINDIRANVKRNYYKGAANLQLLKIAEENYSIAQEFAQKAEIRYKAGEGSNLELLTAKNQLSDAKASIENSRREYLSSLNDLNFSIGNVSNIIINQVQLTDTLSVMENSYELEEIKSRSLENNPLLKKANFNLEASRINKNIAWFNLLPIFNLSYFSQKLSGKATYGVRLGMSIPLWFMFDQKGQIQEANADYEFNSYELQSIKNNITLKITSAFVDYQNAQRQLSLYKNELIPQAEEIFRNASLSYQAGEITYMEFLLAKSTTINTRNNIIKSLLDYKEAIVNLEESSGLILE